jgi:TonB-linked SusC/RagA family outer membrane protein
MNRGAPPVVTGLPVTTGGHPCQKKKKLNPFPMKKNLLLVSASVVLVLLLGSFQAPLFGQAYARIAQMSEAGVAKKGSQLEVSPDRGQDRIRSVRAVLFALEESYRVSFNYDDALVRGSSLKEYFSWKKDEPLEEVLKRLMEKTGLSFEKIDRDNYIIFSEKKKYPDRKRFQTSLRTVPKNLDSSSSLSAFAELLTQRSEVIDLHVSGTVRDDSGIPLPGVNVILKGTTSGTTTDSEGKYALSVPNGDGILIFSFIGYKSQEISINNRVVIDIDMMPDVKSLQEVVVVGYGQQKKIHLTGAVEMLDVSEVEDLPGGNLGAALAGRVLGVSVSGGNTRPGSVSRLLVRNAQTLSKDGGNTDPLFVIDGVIQIGADGTNDATVFNNLDASEVESISFLKDASAAIYGSRGSNGVVIITTKRGKEGKPRISYNGMFGFNDEAYRTKMLSAHEYGMYYNIMNGPYGANETAGDEDYFFSQDELDHFKTINHDWLEEAWSPATSMRHNLNVSGGTEKATFFANASYYTQEGNLSSLKYDRWNFRAGADMEVANNLKAGLQVAGFYSDRIKTFNKIGNENDENDYRNLLKAPRYLPMYVDGYPVKPPGSTSAKNIANYHFFEIERLRNLATNRDQYMTLNLFAEYEVPFVEGLKARASYGRNMGSGRGTQIGTSYTLYEFDRLGTNGHIYDGAEMTEGRKYLNGDRVYFSNRHALSYQANLTLSYARDFGRHSVSGMFTAERGESESSQEDVLKEQPSQSTTGHFGTAFGEIGGKTDFDEAGSMSYAGRANWSYADRYLAEFLFRSDASTKFAPAYYWGKFYSGSVGWVISNEEFYNSNVVDFLKVRYSVGLLGQDDTRAWQWRQRYTFQGGKGAVFGGNEDTSTGMRMEASPNRDATWSDELKNNLGIEARFMKNRLSTTVELFYEKGTRLLLERTGTVPVTVGGTVAAENFGEMDSFGYEVALGWNDQVGDFRYGVDSRFTWYDNEWIVGDFNETAMLYPWEPQPGRSGDNGVWGYDYLGMFRDQEEVDAYVEEYNIEQVFETSKDELKPGMLYYRDVRGPLQADGTFAAPDGIIDENDQVQLARRQGNHYGYGMTLKFGYKSLSFDCVISGSFGGWSEMDRTKLENEINDSYQSVPVFWNNIYDPILHPGGIYPNPHYEDISLDPTSAFWRVSDFRMRVVSLNINYSLPDKVTSALRLNNARVYLSAMNPLNLYNPFGYKDSEGSFDTFPVLRTFALGLNLSL